MINPFNVPHQVAHQKYLPEKLADRHYYKSRDNKRKQEYYKRYQALKKYLYDESE